MIATENLKGKSGVYCAVHRDSLMPYVGSSVNLEKRRQGHLQSVGENRTFFQKALLKFGPESFDFEVLELCPREQLRERENFWLSFYRSASATGFNTQPRSSTFLHNPLSEVARQRVSAGLKASARHQAARKTVGSKLRGQKRSLATIELMRLMAKRPRTEAQKQVAIDGAKRLAALRASGVPVGMSGKHHSDATKQKCRLASLNQKHKTVSEETRAKISAALTGGRRSEESKAKMRAAKLGKKQSPEHIAKCAATRVGVVFSDERRARISAALRGRILSQEAREKIRAKLTGRKMTEEHKQKIRAGLAGVVSQHQGPA